MKNLDTGEKYTVVESTFNQIVFNQQKNGVSQDRNRMFLKIAPGTKGVTKLKLSLKDLKSRGEGHTVLHRQVVTAHNVGRERPVNRRPAQA